MLYFKDLIMEKKGSVLYWERIEVLLSPNFSSLLEPNRMEMKTCSRLLILSSVPPHSCTNNLLLVGMRAVNPQC